MRMFNYKRLFVNASVMAGIFVQNSIWQVTQGTPKDAVVVGTEFDKHRGCFMFLLEHPSFEPVAEGQICGELPSVVIRDKSLTPIGV